ncbi:MAG: T9SS type A sorting domain-containing protein [Crocinitomicaceae bacterium]|nr:T9SS type A sorting domain-containing protein [Crocinitomicaceae bacterium]
MALFVWYMQSDPAFMALQNEPLPLEAQTVPASTGCPSTNLQTYSDYAFWLRCRISETIAYHEDADNLIDNWGWEYDENIDKEHYHVEYLNGNTSFGRTIALMYLITGEQFYYDRTVAIAELVDFWIEENVKVVNGIDYPYYSWFYSWTAGSTECIEDVGHAYLTMQFADICYKNGITHNSTGAPLFDLVDMQKFANTIVFSVYKQPLDFYQTTAGSNLTGAICNTGGISRYAFLADYNPYIFQMMSDYSCEGSIYGSYIAGEAHLATMADLSILQSTFHQSQSINNENFKFNPVAVRRGSSPASSVFNLACGDFNNDQKLDFITVDESVTGNGIFYLYTPSICENPNASGNCWVQGSSAPHGTVQWKGIAGGNFDQSMAPADHNGDELFALESDGSVYFLKVNASTFSEQSVASSFLWQGITGYDFISTLPGDEALAISTGGDLYFIGYYSGMIQLSPAIFSTGFNQIRGIAAGQFDLTDSRPQVAVLDETSGITIYSFDQNSTTFVPIHSYSGLGSGNNWSGFTAGDFDGDAQDELVAHRTTDGQMMIFKVKTTGIEKIYTEYFHPQQQISTLIAGNFGINSFNEQLLVFRNFEGQITLFNIEGNCPNLFVENKTLSTNTSIDNNYSFVENDYILDYHVNNTLLSSDVLIENGTSVDFSAGHAVVLSTGTSVEPGSNFHAYIDPSQACGSDFFLKNQMNQSTEHKGETVPAETVKEDDKKMSVQLYPNPTDDEFILLVDAFILSDSPVLELYTINGVLIKTELIQSISTHISVNELSAGIYFVYIKTESGNETMKLVIE